MTNQTLLNALAEQVAHNEILEKELKRANQLLKERGRRINLLKDNLKDGQRYRMCFCRG